MRHFLFCDVRYLGNKTRLIPFLSESLADLGLEPGVAADPFAGTASVGSALKGMGWRVHAGDVMASSYAVQVARVSLDRHPAFPAELLPPSMRPATASSLSYPQLLGGLARIRAKAGFVTEHFTPDGEAGRRHGRMYFTGRNGRSIDAIRGRIARWRRKGLIDEPREQLLIATLVEAADRVANTTGVYASFVKNWQPNAVRPLELRPLPITEPSNGSANSTAFMGPANELLGRRRSLNLVYLDPPYNERQYPAYYHIPELLAAGWDPPPPLRGKTGLIPDEDRRSDWCRRAMAEQALRRTLAAADARHFLLSYNDEGLIPPEAIAEAFRERGRADSYRCFTQDYKRYRSDADGPGRRYVRDRVRERLHYVAA